jgi:hypothetical protein
MEWNMRKSACRQSIAVDGKPASQQRLRAPWRGMLTGRKKNHQKICEKNVLLRFVAHLHLQSLVYTPVNIICCQRPLLWRFSHANTELYAPIKVSARSHIKIPAPKSIDIVSKAICLVE